VEDERIAELRQDQLESLLAVDDAIAAMIGALEENGELADTLFIFTSDNGYGWGEHRRTNKVAPYEESIRVPLVVRWDALGVPPRTESKLALNTDLAEAVAAAAGIAVETEGSNLLPLMADPAQRWRGRFVIESNLWPDRRVPPYCGFRGERWKYVQYETGEEELYDLVRDPYELDNKARRKNLTATVIAYRGLVQGSRCNPPGFRPLTQCTRMGTVRADRLVGTWRKDWICAGGGNDRILVRGKDTDVVRCGRGIDSVRAGRHDKLRSCEIRLR
jgi:arylsulfatase A-like enzyme